MNPELTPSPGLDPVELALLGGLVVFMLVALGRALWVRRDRARAEEIDPFLVFSDENLRRPMTASPLAGLAWTPAASPDEDDDEGPNPARDPLRQPRMEPAPLPPRPVFRAPVFPPAPVAHGGPTPIALDRGIPVARPVARRDEVDEASETIRLPTAADGTVQILPGSFVIAQGPEVGREFRFLRLGSQQVPEVTIGRVSGPPYRHIQLPAATVSRMHARIRYLDGRWWIANLSATNPVSVNGRELGAGEEPALADGDRVQLGEVELHYQDRRS